MSDPRAPSTSHRDESDTTKLANEFEVTVEQETARLFMHRPHVVILGAGASLAATPNGDRNGKRLPLMGDLAHAAGVDELLVGTEYRSPIGNFEDFYSTLCADHKNAGLLAQVEKRVAEYFQVIQIQNHPTIYDHLVMSLRGQDLVATFNWDPLLLQSYRRAKKMGFRRLPKLAFLHGNVAVGVCYQDRKTGAYGGVCSASGRPLQPVPLLYPIANKDYAKDHFIENEWRLLVSYLENAFMVTIFGYRAPATDTEAIRLMSDAWGSHLSRSLEQTEMIVRPGADHDQVRKVWDRFIHTHHYEIRADFHDSWIARHPRRTGEAYWHQYMDAKFISDNRVPQEADFGELFVFFRSLLEAEELQAASEP